MLSLGTLRPEYENGDMNGQETKTSPLVAVFRFRRENITMLWRESENDTCKQTSKLKTIRDSLLIAHSENILVDEELILLIDVNFSTNLDLQATGLELRAT